LIKFIILYLLILNTFALTKDEDKKYDELEGFPFIKALYKDKKYSDVIKFGSRITVDPDKVGDLNFYLADSYYQIKNYQKAETLLIENEKKTKSDTNQFFLTFAKVQYELKNYTQCIANLNRVNKWVLNAEDWSLFSLCHELNNQADELLDTMININTGDFDFFLESQKILLKNSLHGLASEKRHTFLTTCFKQNDYLALFTLLEKFKIQDQLSLELAHRCHSLSLEITSHLIKHHFKSGNFHSTAYLFSDLSLNDPAFFKHTTEFYKIANRNYVSEYYSTLSDNETYILSKTERYLKDENMALIYSLPLETFTIKENQDLSYAKAYSQLKYLQLTEVKKSIASFKKKTTKEEGFIQLYNKCLSLDWRCRP